MIFNHCHFVTKTLLCRVQNAVTFDIGLSDKSSGRINKIVKARHWPLLELAAFYRAVDED